MNNFKWKVPFPVPHIWKTKLATEISSMMLEYNLDIRSSDKPFFFTELGWKLCGQYIEAFLKKKKIRYRVRSFDTLNIHYQDKLQVTGEMP